MQPHIRGNQSLLCKQCTSATASPRHHPELLQHCTIVLSLATSWHWSGTNNLTYSIFCCSQFYTASTFISEHHVAGTHFHWRAKSPVRHWGKLVRVYFSILPLVLSVAVNLFSYDLVCIWLSLGVFSFIVHLHVCALISLLFCMFLSLLFVSFNA